MYMHIIHILHNVEKTRGNEEDRAYHMGKYVFVLNGNRVIVDRSTGADIVY